MNSIFALIVSMAVVSGCIAASVARHPSRQDAEFAASAARDTRLARRASRSRLPDKGVPQLEQITQDQEPLTRPERSGGGGGGDPQHDYVDYGAHTGHKGSFGWYADFPVMKHN